MERIDDVRNRCQANYAPAGFDRSQRSPRYSLSENAGFASKVLGFARAGQPFWRTFVQGAVTEYSATADSTKMDAWLDRVPELKRDEPRVAYMRYLAEQVRRDGAAAVRVLNALAADYLEDNFYTGPKSYLLAPAYELAGQPSLALEQWQLAERVVREKLAANPNGRFMRPMLAVLLAAQHRTDEAHQTAAACAADERVKGDWPAREVLAEAHVRLGEPDRAIALLSGEHPSTQEWGYVSAATLAVEPRWDTLRDRPGYAQLLDQFRRAENGGAGNPSSAAVKPDPNSVAVLAFDNLSDDKSNEYFSDGISEELISVLSRAPGLTVKGSTSAFYFKHKESQFSSAEIARQLGVTYLVRGSVRKAGDKVRITAQLTRAASDEVVWSSEPLTREVKDVFSVQEEVARLIAQKLQLKFNGATGTRAAVNPEAYELYLQARQAWNLRNADGYDRAEKLLAQSIALAPDFAPAHAALADVWTTRGEGDRSISRWGLRNSPAAARIIEKSRQAIALDPVSAESHASLGMLLGVLWQWPAGERELREAIRLNPNYASAHQWLGRNLMKEGRIDEALAELKQAAELDPLSPRILDNYSMALLNAQRPAEALELAERALRLQPNAEQALAMKAVALAKLGEAEAAAAAAQSLPLRGALNGEIALVTAGKLNAAAALLASLPDDDLGARIAGLVGLGRTAEALTALKPELLVSGMGDLLLFQPVFDPLRSDPRFREVLKTVGLAEANDRAQAWRAAHPPEKVAAK